MHTYLLKCSLAITVASVFLISCNKNAKNVDPKTIDTAEIISHIGGVRNWKGYTAYSGPGGGSSSDVTETFEIIPYPKYINAKGNNFAIDGLDTNSKVVSFRYSPAGSSSFQVRYYYLIDSIYYFEGHTTGVSTQTLSLHTY